MAIVKRWIATYCGSLYVSECYSALQNKYTHELLCSSRSHQRQTTQNTKRTGVVFAVQAIATIRRATEGYATANASTCMPPKLEPEFAHITQGTDIFTRELHNFCEIGVNVRVKNDYRLQHEHGTVRGAEASAYALQRSLEVLSVENRWQTAFASQG